MRQDALRSWWGGRVARPQALPEPAAAAAADRRPRWREGGRRLLNRAVPGVALLLLTLAATLFFLRSAHAGRVYPAVFVADVPVGGLTREEAQATLDRRAAAIEGAAVVFSYGDRRWQVTMRDVGVTVNSEVALTEAFAIGREDGARDRLRAAAGLLRGDARLPLPLELDDKALGRWFDQIDRELGLTPREASLVIAGTDVTIVPEVEGVVVDRARARALVIDSLGAFQPLAAPLPTLSDPPRIRAADLAPTRDFLIGALGQPVQITFNGGVWTLPARDLGRFISQLVDPHKQGAEAITLGFHRAALAAWLDERLGPEINREPRDAIVGWGGDGLVSLEWSVDGAELDVEMLAGLVEASFFGDHKPVAAPVAITKPAIDSNNLGALGIVTLLGSGNSNYSGSSGERAINVEVGARLLNGTLVRPGATFSFNNAIGYITEEKGYVEAQVIDGERIGKDVGGGICQVSTTVFRAAYNAGLPITEWWPHRFRIPFYEYDGWPPGLDASILQPFEDPATWDDFKFENATESWLLVESWTDGVVVVVNIYGADLGWRVETDGPRYGKKFQMLPDREVVDPELEPGTYVQSELAEHGVEVGHYRAVYDRDGNLLWERNYYTKYYPRGNVWKVSPDMKGKSPSDPDRELPKVEDEPIGEEPLAE